MRPSYQGTLELINQITLLVEMTTEEIREKRINGLQFSSRKDNFSTRLDKLISARGMLDLVTSSDYFSPAIKKYEIYLATCKNMIDDALRGHQQLPQEQGKLENIGGKEKVENKVCSTERVDKNSGENLVVTNEACTVDGVEKDMSDDLHFSMPSPTISTTHFDNLIGCESAKQALRENIVLPLSLPPSIRDSIFVGPRAASANVLLYGAPGTGKTSLAEAAAGEAGARFYSLSPSSILSKYQGESERTLRSIFMQAKAAPPAVIFFDEIDALGCNRDGCEDLQGRRLLAELLLQVGSISSKDGIAIIAATNRAEDVDLALLRRFHARIQVQVPEINDLLRMCSSFLSGVQHSITDAELSSISSRLEGWSGSDVRALCREAALGPVREMRLCANLGIGAAEPPAAADVKQENSLTKNGARTGCNWLNSSNYELLVPRPVTAEDMHAAYAALMHLNETCGGKGI